MVHGRSDHLLLRCPNPACCRLYSGSPPDETSAAIVRLRETTVIVYDLKSDHPRLTTDTRINVLDLRVTVSIVVLVGEGTVATWDLPTEYCVLDASAGINDSVLTTRFDYRPPLVPRTLISLYA